MSYSVFLSHNSADKPDVEAIARRLEGAGIRCWYDSWSLRQGEQWMAGLEEGLSKSQACAVFFGRSGMGPWQEMERKLVLLFAGEAERTKRHFRVIPVRLPGAPPWNELNLSPFLRLYPGIQFTSVADSKALRLLKLGIEGLELGAPGALGEGASPYIGMRAFREGDSHLFFGRDEELVEIAERLTETRTPRLLLVLGASGSGKSSLIFGGLLPHLRAGKFLDLTSEEWLIVAMQPGLNAVENLRNALAGHHLLLPYLSSFGSAETKPTRSALHSVAASALGNIEKKQRLLVVVDQFETLFTQQPEEPVLRSQYRDQVLLPFLDMLTYAAVEPTSPVTAIVTARSDFFGIFADEGLLKPIIEDHRHRLILKPLEGQRLRDVIERPALALGADFQEGLVDALVEDFLVQPAGALPFLQEALARIWERREFSSNRDAPESGNATLTVNAYLEIGRLRGALDAHAERVWQRLDSAFKEVSVAILVHLVRLGEGGEPDTKRRVASTDLPGGKRGRDCALRLAEADARLLTVDNAGGAGAQVKSNTLEIAHEALLKGWRRLNEWLIDDLKRPRRLKIRRWEATARAWQLGGDDAPGLLRRGDLRKVRSLLAALPDETPPILAEYVSASRRINQRRNSILALIAAGFTVAAVALFLFDQKMAEDEKIVGHLISDCESASIKPDLRYLLADQALERCKPQLKAQVSKDLLQASIDLGPGEKAFKTVYFFGKKGPWNFEETEPAINDSEQWKLPGETISVPSHREIIVDPLKRWIFLVRPLGFLRLDLASPERDYDAAFYYRTEKSAFWYSPDSGEVASSLDGKTVVAHFCLSDSNHEILVWNGPGPPTTRLKGDGLDAYAELMLDPSGRFFTVGKFVWLTDSKSGSSPKKALTMAPDAISADGTVLLAVERPYSEDVSQLPDDQTGDTTASGISIQENRHDKSWAWKLHTWDATKDFQEQTIPTSSEKDLETLLREKFHPIFLHSKFVTAAESERVKLQNELRGSAPGWKLEIVSRDSAEPENKEIAITCHRESQAVQTSEDRIDVVIPDWNGEAENRQPVAISPDGRWLAVISKTLRIWDLSSYSNSKFAPLELTSAQGDCVRFSPDGRWLAAADSTVQVRSRMHLFDMRLGAQSELSVPLLGDLRKGDFIDFSSDGRWLITAVSDGSSVRAYQFWDLTPTRQQRLGERMLTQEECKIYFPSGTFPQTPSQSADSPTASQAAKIIADVERSFADWEQRCAPEDSGDPPEHESVAPADVVTSANSVYQTGLEELRSAKQQNATLCLDPDLHCSGLAEIYFLPAVQYLARHGDLARSLQLLKAVKTYCPQTLATDQGLSEKAARFLERRARKLAEAGDAVKTQETLTILKTIRPARDDKLTSSLNWSLALARISQAGEGPVSADKLQSIDDGFAFLQQNQDGADSGEKIAWASAANDIAHWALEQSDLHQEANVTVVVKYFERAQDILVRQGIRSLDARTWNSLCWKCTLNGHAKQVLEYGWRAVEEEPGDSYFKDNLGIALALSGDLAGSADMFKKCLDARSSSARSMKIYSYWINLLRNGVNPFTPKLVQELSKASPNEAVLLGE